jgi:hypothetical protein
VSRVRESTTKPVGKPDAGNRHVRFAERGWETGRRGSVGPRAQPRLYHSTLGTLGRIRLPEMPDGRRTHVSCEIAEVDDDPANPITMQRRAVFEPLGVEIARQMEHIVLRRLSDRA